jgi:ABC-type uncharacterized transport system substrate-binding protein
VTARRLAAVACLTALAACKPGADKAGGRDSAGAGASADTGAAAAGAPAAGSVPTIAIIRAADWIGSEWSEDAIRVGLREQGLEENRDFRFDISSAQGDLATLPGLLDKAVDSKARVIVTLQDPTLKAAVQRVKNTPIVFHVLADPFAAGAGTSDSNHLANVTGVYSPGLGDPEQEKRVALIKRVVPNAHRVGVLFSSDEPYAVAMKDKMVTAGRKVNIQVVGVPVANAAEAGTAAQSLVGQKVDAIEIFGNSAHSGFPAIMQAAKAAKVPVFSPSPFEMLKGATAAIYPDFADGGIVAGQMIARIMKGEDPGKIPFYKVEKTKTDMGTGGKQTAAAGAADTARAR